MKKILLISVLMVLCGHIAFGWGGVGHKAVAQIAENHISKSTKKTLKKYLAGATAVEVASDADKYYYQWSRDIGFECSNPKILRRQPSDMDMQPSNIEPWCHSYTVDSLFNTYRHNREGDVYVRNAVMDLDFLINDLKENKDNMDKDECVMKLSVVIHLLGDMHCPMHVLYIPQDPTGGKYSIYKNGKKIGAHSYWDGGVFKLMEPEWSYFEYAEAADTATPEEIAEIQVGDVYDWGKSSATNCFVEHAVYSVGGEQTSTPIEGDRPLLYTQLRNAGYRLAKTLEYIFEIN